MYTHDRNLCITQGNSFTLLVSLTQQIATPTGEDMASDVAGTASEVTIYASNGRRIEVEHDTAPSADVPHWQVADTDTGKAIAVTVPAAAQHIDRYGLEIKGATADGTPWRYKAKPGEAFTIVDATSDQHIPDSQVRIYALSASVGIGAGIGGSIELVQSDWNEADDTSPAFIKNKPTIPSLTGYATINYVNSYVNASLTGYVTAGYVDSYVSNQLSNYATQQWVNEQNFLKEHQSLDGYATQQWVNEQNFLKEHQDISGKENRMQIIVPNSLTFSAETGKYYRITQSGTITVTLPSVQSDYIEVFLLFFTAASDDCLHFDTQDSVIFADGYEIKAGDICEVNAIYNGSGWQVTVIKFNS